MGRPLGNELGQLVGGSWSHRWDCSKAVNSYEGKESVAVVLSGETLWTRLDRTGFYVYALSGLLKRGDGAVCFKRDCMNGKAWGE